jgi:superoxide dismutase, Cu-Zn family
MAMMRVVLMAAAVCAASAPSAWAESARADIISTADGSTSLGSAVLTESPDGLQIAVHVTGAPAGNHAIHIHQYGRCGDRGNDAGGHFNPDNTSHGFVPTDGIAKAHTGDMGNIEVGADGDGRLSVFLPGVTLAGGKHSVAGRTIVLHEKADDFGQPTGNAGGRAGCGPILFTKVLGDKSDSEPAPAAKSR